MIINSMTIFNGRAICHASLCISRQKISIDQRRQFSIQYWFVLKHDSFKLDCVLSWFALQIIHKLRSIVSKLLEQQMEIGKRLKSLTKIYMCKSSLD